MKLLFFIGFLMANFSTLQAEQVSDSCFLLDKNTIIVTMKGGRNSLNSSTK